MKYNLKPYYRVMARDVLKAELTASGLRIDALRTFNDAAVQSSAENAARKAEESVVSVQKESLKQIQDVVDRHGGWIVKNRMEFFFNVVTGLTGGAELEKLAGEHFRVWKPFHNIATKTLPDL